MIDSNFKNAKILVVDDQQANVDILFDFFEMQGYENIKSTTDPRKVVFILEDFEPDIILLDLSMPYLSGFDVMEQIKKNSSKLSLLTNIGANRRCVKRNKAKSVDKWCK